MKKVLALVLAVVMALGMASVALAVYTPGKTEEIGFSIADGTKLSDLRVKTDWKEGKSLVKVTLGEKDNGDPVIKLAFAKDFGTKLNNLKGTITITDKYGKVSDKVTFSDDVTVNEDGAVVIEDKVGWITKEPAYEDGAQIDLVDVDSEDFDGISVYEFKGDKKYDIDFKVPNADVMFTVPMYKQGKVNMAYSGSADKKLVVANPDANIDFVNFLAAPSFDYNGELKFYGEKDELFVYGYADGKVTDLKLTWSEDDGAYILKTNKLGSYVVSDKKLASAPATGDGDKDNPGMGANDMVNVAVVAAVVSLAAAGAVAFKKASK